jgi:hypothetical protein
MSTARYLYTRAVRTTLIPSIHARATLHRDHLVFKPLFFLHIYQHLKTLITHP